MPKKNDPIQNLLADARRNQILDAATQVFAEKGFHDATIRQVAKRAGIADGTIYLYFKNKDELLLGILDRLNETQQRPHDLAQASQRDFKSFFHSYIRHRLVLIGENFQAFQAMLPDVLANPQLRALYWNQVIEPSFDMAEGFFEEWVKQGLIKPVNVPIALRAITGVFVGMMVLRMLGDTTIEKEWDNLPEQVADLILDGVGEETNNEHTRTRTKKKTPKNRTH